MEEEPLKLCRGCGRPINEKQGFVRIKKGCIVNYLCNNCDKAGRIKEK